jgi:anti-sigma factor RsiW
VSIDSVRDEELHAFVDRELDAARSGEIEALLAREPEAARVAHTFQEQKALLHVAFDSVLDEPVPVRLAHRRPARSWRAAAAIAWLALGAGLGWALRGTQEPARSVQLPRQAAVAHAAFTPEVRHPVEVTAKEEAHLVGWLSKRLGAPVRAPKLGALGYELLGGRLLPESGRPGAQFMYQDAGGRRLTLYVSTDVDNRDTAFRYINEGGLHVFYWVDRTLGYALSGELDKQEMLRVARAVYEQLNP